MNHLLDTTKGKIAMLVQAIGTKCITCYSTRFNIFAPRTAGSGRPSPNVFVLIDRISGTYRGIFQAAQEATWP